MSTEYLLNVSVIWRLVFQLSNGRIVWLLDKAENNPSTCSL